MCIKGINKRVIEVTASENSFFEKAVLYVRPECAAVSDSRLADIAKEYTDMLEESAPSDMKQARRHRIFSNALVVITSAVLLISAAFIAAAFMLQWV